MKVITYVRPWNKSQFEFICETAFPESEVVSFSDFKSIVDNRLVDDFYEIYKNYRYIPNNFDLTDEEISDIIARCRLLRDIRRTEAIKLICCMWLSISKLFDFEKPDVCIGLTVDSYVIDLVSIKCQKLGIPYYGIVVSFVNGYFRLTTRGEYNKLYSPSEDEVEKVYNDLLEKKIRPHFLDKPESKFDSLKRIIKNQIKVKFRYIYFSLKKVIKDDKLCYHYWVSQISSKIKFTCRLTYSSRNWKSKLNISNGNNIYIPLQYFPEATVDYWVPEIEYINYYDTLYKILDQIEKDSNYNVLVKEHPAILGMRPNGFYDKLLSYKCLTLLPSHVDSLEVIDKSDITIVWTGTAGFESAIRGKKVIHLGKPYYIDSKSFVYLEDINNIRSELSTEGFEAITDKDKKILIRKLISGMLPGTFKNPKRHNFSWKYDSDEMIRVGESIKNYHNKFRYQ